jgi:hypothetical protein
VLRVSLPNVAQEVCWLLVLARAELVWAFVQVLALMGQFASNQLDIIPELFVADRAFEIALGNAFEPVFAVLGDVGGDRDLIPVEANPILNFG